MIKLIATNSRITWRGYQSMAESTIRQDSTADGCYGKLTKHLRIGETIIEGSLLLAGLISIAVTVGIVIRTGY